MLRTEVPLKHCRRRLGTLASQLALSSAQGTPKERCLILHGTSAEGLAAPAATTCITQPALY
jgi:hypothetical protein